MQRRKSTTKIRRTRTRTPVRVAAIKKASEATPGSWRARFGWRRAVNHCCSLAVLVLRCWRQTPAAGPSEHTSNLFPSATMVIPDMQCWTGVRKRVDSVQYYLTPSHTMLRAPSCTSTISAIVRTSDHAIFHRLVRPWTWDQSIF